MACDHEIYMKKENLIPQARFIEFCKLSAGEGSSTIDIVGALPTSPFAVECLNVNTKKKMTSYRIYPAYYMECTEDCHYVANFQNRECCYYA